MITTIQLNEDVKNALDRMKSNKETYEQVILNLMKIAEECKRKQEELLIEGCKIMAKDMIEINKEWEQTDADIDWEWNNGNKKRRHITS
jgi:predicted CopG family antitoxin